MNVFKSDAVIWWAAIFHRHPSEPWPQRSDRTVRCSRKHLALPSSGGVGRRALDAHVFEWLRRIAPHDSLVQDTRARGNDGSR